jgi:hypothetical protein
MCTVSFVQQMIVLSLLQIGTKNTKTKCHSTKSYTVNGQILFKDPKAGGTWFVANADGTILVLLNGAAEKHEVQLPYRKAVVDCFRNDQ